MDSKRVEKYTSQYPIFNVKDKKGKYSADNFLGQDFDKIEIICRRLANSNQEFYDLMEYTPLSEVVRLFGIDSAINYSEMKNAESK